MRIQDILYALDLEINKTSKSISGVVHQVRASGKTVELVFEEDIEGLSETLEEAMAWWGQGQWASVTSVNPEEYKVVIRVRAGAPPTAGSRVRFYPPKYLAKLHEFWSHEGHSKMALRVLETLERSSIEVPEAPRKSSSFTNRFPELRNKQKEALRLLDQNIGFLWGPPGTGKTFTVGALIATILIERPKARVLLLATTNRAVDEALISVDKRLESLRLQVAVSEVRNRIRRYGSNFDASRYVRESRHHLVADASNGALISEIAKLEQDQPDKLDSVAHSKWKERIENLRAQIPKPDMNAPLLAMTATAATYVLEHLNRAPFDYVVFDEASQLSLPYACALGTLGKKLLFAGDNQQLAPIVVSEHPTAREILGASAFIHMRAENENCCQLDEQDRMAPEICYVVSDMFYKGKLQVAENSESNPVWRAERRIRDLPSVGRNRLYIELCLEKGKFVTQGGARGVYRPASAERSVALAKECLEEQSDIAILTPFRKQRRDIRRLLHKEGLRDVHVSTVHSVQGGQFHTVIFDPVLGDPVRIGGRLLSDEGEARRLVNVAISRAKSRFIVLLAPCDLQNKVLQELADAIEIQNAEGHAEWVSIESLVDKVNFPAAFVGQYVQHNEVHGKLADPKKEKFFTIITRGGKRRNFSIHMPCETQARVESSQKLTHLTNM